MSSYARKEAIVKFFCNDCGEELRDFSQKEVEQLRVYEQLLISKICKCSYWVDNYEPETGILYQRYKFIKETKNGNN